MGRVLFHAPAFGVYRDAMTAAVARKSSSGLRALIGLTCLIVALLAVPGPRLVESLSRAGVGLARTGQAWVGDAVHQVRVRIERPDNALAVAGAAPGETLLSGAYDPTDDRTREVAGRATFIGAELRFESGGALKTRPHRIVTAQDALAPGLTFGQAMQVPAGVQVEVRQVTSGAAPGPCGGAAIGWLGIVQADETVRILPLRGATPPGAAMDPAAPCPLLSLERR